MRAYWLDRPWRRATIYPQSRRSRWCGRRAGIAPPAIASPRARLVSLARLMRGRAIGCHWRKRSLTSTLQVHSARHTCRPGLPPPFPAPDVELDVELAIPLRVIVHRGDHLAAQGVRVHGARRGGNAGLVPLDIDDGGDEHTPAMAAKPSSL